MVGLILLSCTAGQMDDSGSSPAVEPWLGEQIQVVPGEGLPAQVLTQDANNNLDVTWHEGQAWLAFRTAPDHFASEDATLYVLRSEDQQTWTHELTVHLGTDLREPRLLSWQGRLILYYAVLGTDPLAFEPQGTMVTVREADGTWTEPIWWRQDSFIPWRIHVLDGVPMMTGYTEGGEIYDLGEGEYPEIEVYWLRSEDGLTWTDAVPGQPVVYVGGTSETDLAFADDGAVIAVMRDEAGAADGFGSRICRGEPGAPGDWTCALDPRKYDSPLVFSHGGRIWLIGRRNVTETGAYDLSVQDPSYDDLDHGSQALAYQAAYWSSPKRCSLWEVDPVGLAVTWVLDLPSRGDTCFASVLPEEDGSYTVYNYSSDPEGPDLSWIEGQTDTTQIYRQPLWWE